MCLFCIAVFAVLAGTITTALLDEMESRLTQVSDPDSVSRLTDSASTTTISASVPVPSIPGQAPSRLASAPVLVTVYKAQKRVRIQVQTHDITVAQAHAVQDVVASACGLRVVTRSSEATQHMVQQASQQAQAEPLPSGTTRPARRVGRS